ncbi:hypothetical protein AX14_001355 [Amanita brunnescens Koide BX004]|nr:hypothetical protein AX14_001355 [Amanita brunnescens Koide BX004]
MEYRILGSGVMAVFQDNVDIDKWPEYLQDTMWIRLPDILGKGNSGPEERLNDLMKINSEDDVLFVTFFSPDHNYKAYGAQESYKLTNKQAQNVKDGYIATHFPNKKHRGRQHFKFTNAQPLLSNTNAYLQGFWGRVEVPVEPRTWTNSKHLDDLIEIIFGNEANPGVQKLTLLRLRRRQKRISRGSSELSNIYSVIWSRRTINKCPAEMETFLEDVPVDKWREYLDKTDWGRLPTILGQVSDNVIFRKPDSITYVTDKIGPTGGRK